jgi:hypothetical protein
LNDLSECDIGKVKAGLKQCYCETWETSRYEKMKLRYYNMYKMSYGIENYVKSKLSRVKRSLLAQFRGGILPINVEIGRFRNIPLAERTCQLCENDNLIEDEFHILCICSAYNDVRTELYNNIITNFDENFLDFDDFEKFIFINTDYQILLASYLQKAMEIRKNTLFSHAQ